VINNSAVVESLFRKQVEIGVSVKTNKSAYKDQAATLPTYPGCRYTGSGRATEGL